ncbi:MAG: hypothetical protein NTW17_03220 [Candidatus Pacearchaeota archaeon]|nr:hypothetical protein [Candidatus Pacearchaeota archaeon]
MRNKNMGNVRGQVTIFIIIAIVIIALVAGYLLLKGSFGVKEIPSEIAPAYNSFLACLQEDVSTGINVLESRGGYIELPGFEPGSTYMPFSSQLNFAGNPIPYWYYVSGNNIQKEQIPTKNEMENQLEIFLESRIRDCNLRGYYDQGFVISMGEPNADVIIKENSVDVDLSMPLVIEKGNDTASVKSHKISKVSSLGKLYDSAKIVYEEEQKNLFLENYGIDALGLYAPVDGVEITCAPLTWDAEKIFDDLQEAIEANTLALKSKGAETDYFALKLPIDENVRFLNSRNWSNSFEISPADDRILIATPVGNQQGLGILGFCYVPYHFVYNIKYPVLVQIYNEEEIFQFPVGVVIQGNNPREALNATASEDIVPELCKYKNTEIQINAYDTNFVPVDADISYECFGNRCDIGSTNSGILKAEFPQCVNGFVSAKAEGFKTTRYLFSTVNEGALDIILERIYPTDVKLLLDGKIYNGSAMMTFTSDYATNTLVYPEQKIVNLGEGEHDIQVEIYKNSQITIGATTKEQCVQVPRGILGVFGLTKDKCFTIQVPEQVISNALAGGGKQTKYILESELIKGNTLEINVKSLPVPETIEQLQNNYLLFDENELGVEFVK